MSGALPIPDWIKAGRRELGAGDIDSAPNDAAVFLLWADEGRPYLARTGVLRRRLSRLLRRTLFNVVRRVEWYPVASRLESFSVLYHLARHHLPAEYPKIIRLGNPAYVRLSLANAYPRASITTRLGGRSSYFGPFRSRAAAEAFQAQALDLFQLRRCQEDLAPTPAHPGCIYGEMNMCLRPCQQVVGPEEYASEVRRVRQFLLTGGASLVETVSAARDRFSQEMEFEEAARQHRRLQKIDEVLRLRDELAADVNELFGVAVTPAPAHEAVLLWFLERGTWHQPVRLPLSVEGGRPVSLDHKLRDIVRCLPQIAAPAAERQEHLALLAKWFYSSWRDGEWIGSPGGWERVPYRRLVNSIARVSRQPRKPGSSSAE